MKSSNLCHLCRLFECLEGASFWIEQTSPKEPWLLAVTIDDCVGSQVHPQRAHYSPSLFRKARLVLPIYLEASTPHIEMDWREAPVIWQRPATRGNDLKK